MKNVNGSFLHANTRPLAKHEQVLIFYDKIGKFNHQFGKRDKSYSMVRTIGLDTNYGRTGYEKKVSDKDTIHPTTLLDFKVDKDRAHPTQKPVKLFEYMIKTYSDEGDLVFDPFSGSGTTALASKNTDRNCIVCEIDPTYYKYSLERLAGTFRQRIGR